MVKTKERREEKVSKEETRRERRENKRKEKTKERKKDGSEESNKGIEDLGRKGRSSKVESRGQEVSTREIL